MKWGVRRYQNKDGSLTEAGKRKYLKIQNKYTKQKEKFDKRISKTNQFWDEHNTNSEKRKAQKALTEAAKKKHDKIVDDFMKVRMSDLENGNRSTYRNNPAVKAFVKQQMIKNVVNFGAPLPVWLAGKPSDIVLKYLYSAEEKTGFRF